MITQIFLQTFNYMSHWNYTTWEKNMAADTYETLFMGGYDWQTFIKMDAAKVKPKDLDHQAPPPPSDSGRAKLKHQSLA